LLLEIGKLAFERCQPVFRRRIGLLLQRFAFDLELEKLAARLEVRTIG
jgi:hypothetical protein